MTRAVAFWISPALASFRDQLNQQCYSEIMAPIYNSFASSEWVLLQ
ncbi:hypothetical protein ACPOL_6156 [Acidisarcina polymorpha]|uniref:Uncharacterized protein n=1 Tax=Acidisarcina polymorpha TaxID=2211140 RepID=A0A2Z5G8V6_9BACT|nr:hypothetical protein ACPOL_6156 [Acidisarcina polymorpha]